MFIRYVLNFWLVLITTVLPTCLGFPTKEVFHTELIAKLSSFLDCTLLHVPPKSNSPDISSNLYQIPGTSLLILNNLAKLINRKPDVLRTKKYSPLCTIAVVDIYGNNINDRIEKVVQLLTHPIFRPLTVPNQDYYIFRTNQKNQMNLILQHELISHKFRFKIVVSADERESAGKRLPVKVKTLCLFCNKGSSRILDLSSDIVGVDERTLSTILFPDFHKTLRGKQLRASLFTRPSSTVHVRKINGTYKAFKTGGVGLRTFITLSETLNFTYSFIPETAMGIKGKNGTWNGIVGDVMYGRAEFGLTNAIVLSRFLAVDFATPFAYLNLGFVHGPPAQIFSWQSIFWPFNLTIWIWIIGTTIIVIIFLLLLHFFTKKANLERDHDMWSTAGILGFVGASYVMQITEEPKGLPMKWFALSWYNFIVVITTLYLSRLFELYVGPPREIAPNDFTELAYSDYDISMTYFGGAIVDFFQNSVNGSGHKRIFHRMKKQSVLGCHQDAQKAKTACIAFDLVAETTVWVKLGDKYGRSDLILKKTADLAFPFAISIPKRWILKDRVNRVISSLFECGFEIKWKFKTFQDLREARFKKDAQAKSTTNNSVADDTIFEDTEELPLSFDHLTGCFSVLPTGLSLSLMSFLAEFCKHIFERYGKRKVGNHSDGGDSYKNKVVNDSSGFERFQRYPVYQESETPTELV